MENTMTFLDKVIVILVVGFILLITNGKSRQIKSVDYNSNNDWIAIELQ